MKLLPFLSKIIRSTLVLILILTAASCTKEDMSMCDLYLKFRYDYNMISKDLFKEQVEQVKVFIFDRNGNYITSFSESGEILKKDEYRMQIPYTMHGCTMVVWAGHTENFYTLPEMAAGDPLEKLTLRYNPGNNTCSHKIDDLWHSGPAIMTFTEENNTTQTVSLTRNTNDIGIQITDKKGNSRLDEFNIVINSSNGVYNYKNQYLPDNPVLTYLPYGYTGNNNQEALARTLRLMENDRVTLTITGAGGNPVDIGGVQTINLVEYLLMSTPSGMGAQEYFDRCYEWNLSLIIEDSLVLAISINGWVHWLHPIEM